MSDSDGKKTLGLRGGPRAGNVKQSFSHGRSKSVVVETKRKRVVVPKSGTAKPMDGAQATECKTFWCYRCRNGTSDESFASCKSPRSSRKIGTYS